MHEGTTSGTGDGPFTRADAAALAALTLDSDADAVTRFLTDHGVLDDHRAAVDALLTTARLLQESIWIWHEQAFERESGHRPDPAVVRDLVLRHLRAISLEGSLESPPEG